MKVAVIGVGNILLKDEGFGVFVAKYLQENYQFCESLTIIDGGTGGYSLLKYLQDYEQIIIIDVIHTDGKPGSVYKIEEKDFSIISSFHKTVHEVDIAQVVEFAKLVGKSGKVKVIAVVPKDINTLDIGLTEEIKKNFKYIIKHILKEIRQLGICFKKKHHKPLDKIISDFFEN